MTTTSALKEEKARPTGSELSGFKYFKYSEWPTPNQTRKGPIENGSRADSTQLVGPVDTGSRAEGAQLVGIVKRYSSKNGYGFITVEDGGPDCFVHQSEIVVEGFRCLEEGARVQFRHVTRNGKPTATQVRPLPGSRFKVYKSRADALTKVVQTTELGHVSGFVKWFDVQKGFGFIVLDESTDREQTDVFVHIKEVASQLPLQEGQRVGFDLMEESGGRFRAFNVCPATDASAPPVQFFGENPTYVAPYQPQLTGTVKFFNTNRGFGFITPSDGSPDIYFSRLALVAGGDAVNANDFVGFDVMGNEVKIWAINVCPLDYDQGIEFAPVLYPYPYDQAAPYVFDNVSFDPNMVFYPQQ